MRHNERKEQIFAGRWSGDPTALHLTEGVMLHWFPPEVMPRLRMTPSTRDLVRRHAELLHADRYSSAPSAADASALTTAHRSPHPRTPSAATAGGRTVLNVIGVHLYLENADGEVLLGLRHPDSAYAGSTWHFLAGHCEQESAVTCLVREAREEAGLLIDPADVTYAHAVHLVDAPGIQPRMQLVFRARRWTGTPEILELVAAESAPGADRALHPRRDRRHPGGPPLHRDGLVLALRLDRAIGAPAAFSKARPAQR